MIEYSVIIPTRNRVKILNRCLAHLAKLDAPFEGWEVIVVDNGSNDKTKKVVFAFREVIGNLKYFYDNSPGLHIGRHIGLEEAEGNILCYIDDDSFVAKKWLRGIERAFLDSRVMLVGGPILPEYEMEPPGWLRYFWIEEGDGNVLGTLSLLDYGNQSKTISPYRVFGCNFNIRKDILLKIGGFHPDGMPRELVLFRGDGETSVSEGLLELAYSALYSPDAKVCHFIPLSRMTIKYFRQRAYYQGISDSFTEIRNNGGLIGIRRRTPSPLSGNEPYIGIKKDTHSAYVKGFNYHQSEVRNDPTLHEWVLREKYFGKNGKLPVKCRKRHGKG